MTLKYEKKKAVMTADWISKRDDILSKWGEFKNSTKREFVSYSDNLNSRSTVDYEDGKIEIEAVVSDGDIKKAEQELNEQAAKIVAAKDPEGNNLVSDQIDISKMQTEIKKESDEPKKSEEKQIEPVSSPEKIIEKIPVQKTVIQTDSKTQKKVTIIKKTIPLKENHAVIRAQKYLDLIKKYSAEYNLEPEFVMAVIETESYFNPYARSGVPAFGLMQLVPHTGAYDASKTVFGKYQKISADLLYIPETNIHLGTVYFNIIFNRYLSKLKKHNFKHLIASTAAYNCGPTKINRIISKKNFSEMSDPEFYAYIKSEVPDETKSYIDKVFGRTKKYYKLTETLK
jgi:membrane-bound lytic murein transglycosylase C